MLMAVGMEIAKIIDKSSENEGVLASWAPENRSGVSENQSDSQKINLDGLTLALDGQKSVWTAKKSTWTARKQPGRRFWRPACPFCMALPRFLSKSELTETRAK